MLHEKPSGRNKQMEQLIEDGHFLWYDFFNERLEEKDNERGCFENT